MKPATASAAGYCELLNMMKHDRRIDEVHGFNGILHAHSSVDTDTDKHTASIQVEKILEAELAMHYRSVGEP